MARCDIAVLMIDAQAGVTSQDKKVAGKIVERNKACLIVVNKWDLVGPEVDAARQEAHREENAASTAATELALFMAAEVGDVRGVDVRCCGSGEG